METKKEEIVVYIGTSKTDPLADVTYRVHCPQTGRNLICRIPVEQKDDVLGFIQTLDDEDSGILEKLAKYLRIFGMKEQFNGNKKSNP